MIPFFVQIKCHMGKSYQVANALADAEIAEMTATTRKAGANTPASSSVTCW